MNISDYKKYEPIFGSWYITKAIGQGSFGSVFEIQRTEFGRTYESALKIISIPQDPDEIKKMELDGMAADAIKRYYDNVVRDIVNELVIMSELRGNSNIVSYEDHAVLQHEDGIGYDILIRMELLTSLIQYRAEHPLTERDVAKLGVDLCKALELCEANSIIHRDIKPENIFVAKSGNYKLGDFGIARTIEKTSSELSRKGTYSYMAPEIYNGGAYETSVDIYSLGIVMYALLNGNRSPFLPPAPAEITHNQKEDALVRRMRGERIPPLSGVSTRLMNIILKACAYKPTDRFTSAFAMRNELERYLRDDEDTEQTDELVLPTAASAEWIASEATEVLAGDDPLSTYQQTIPQEAGVSYTDHQHSEPNKTVNTKLIMIGLIALLVILCGIGTALVIHKMSSGKDSNIDATNAGNTVTEEAQNSIPEDAVAYNGHHYKLYNVSGTWSDAKGWCESVDGHLVTITSSEEEAFVEQLIEDYQSEDMHHFWLGATDRDRAEDDFIWVTGEKMTYKHFEPGQPNHKEGQDYLEIQATLGDNGNEEYMTWTDVTNDGISPGLEKAPEYNSTPYYGYICEWDE